jgi:hypothetical protein
MPEVADATAEAAVGIAEVDEAATAVGAAAEAAGKNLRAFQEPIVFAATGKIAQLLRWLLRVTNTDFLARSFLDRTVIEPAKFPM